MTIKHLGGIFGRNPTFNDAEIDGSLNVDNDTLIVEDGKVGIGTSPTTLLEVKSGTSPVVQISNGGGTSPFPLLSFYRQAGVAGHVYYDTANKNLVLQNDFAGKIQFNISGTSAPEFNSSGNLAFPSGQGIDFSATSGTGTSELFDDYEEGTWTPTIAAGSGTFATVSAAGRYTKTGRMVIAQLRIFLTDSTGGSGWINISNFPFANSQASYAVAYGESPSGQMIRGTIGASSVNIFEYDNTDPVVNGNYSVTLIYEAT
jgi:hypothetical protein